jgi:RNA polymerase sigma factor (sigma-70 family)
MSFIPPACVAAASVACFPPDGSPILAQPTRAHAVTHVLVALPAPGRGTRLTEPVSPHEQQFLDALPVIADVIRDLGRRYHLSRDEQEDFAGAVHQRLIEQDYAVLRRFEGRSSLATFLRTVITRQWLDHRTREWGRWRPSADAVRLGPTAVALERLLERQRLPLEQAVEALCTRDPALGDHMLRELAARLPHRVTGRRHVDDTGLQHSPAPDRTPEQLLEDARAASTQATMVRALRALLATLSPREQLLLRLRYEHGATVANIARVLNEEQKPLYRQLDRLLARLRQDLEARGVSAADVRDIAALSLDDEDPVGDTDPQPSVSRRQYPAAPGSVTG